MILIENLCTECSIGQVAGGDGEDHAASRLAVRGNYKKEMKMKRPTWATIVGILGIIFGCFGILGGGQEIFLPKILKMQNEVFTKIEKMAKEQQAQRDSEIINNEQDGKNPRPAFSLEIFEPMKKMFEVPDWFGLWSVLSGLAKAIVSAIYLLASIWLLQTKPLSVRLFYWAAGSSIALSILRGIIILSAFSFMGIAMMFGGAFGALIDIILIIVVVTGDKEAFQLQPAGSKQ